MAIVNTQTLGVDLLKDRFPEYRWNDASDKSVEQIRYIVANLCHNIKDLAILVKKTEKNTRIFDDIFLEEIKSNKITENIDTIVFNSDKYMYFSKDSNHIISSLRKNLFEKMECLSCFDEYSSYNSWTCSNCTANICIDCLKRVMIATEGIFNCPICREKEINREFESSQLKEMIRKRQNAINSF